MRNPYFVKIVERVSPFSIVLLIDFSARVSETGEVLSLNKFIRGWYREKNMLKTIIRASPKIIFPFGAFTALFKPFFPYMELDCHIKLLIMKFLSRKNNPFVRKISILTIR